jgi:hypothetical protein
MSINVNPPGPNDLNYSQSDNIIGAVKASSASSIFWMDPSVALWVRACVAAGHSVGIPGCPSREVADTMLATLGA